MEAYIVYTPDKTVLGGVNADGPKEAAETVVNAQTWPPDTGVATVNVARATSREASVGDTIDLTDPHIVVERTNVDVYVGS